MDQLRNAIGTFFYAHRKACGKSLEQVANGTGFTPSRIKLLEEGKSDWPLCDLMELVSFYDVRNQFMEILISEEASFNSRNPKKKQ